MPHCTNVLLREVKQTACGDHIFFFFLLDHIIDHISAPLSDPPAQHRRVTKNLQGHDTVNTVSPSKLHIDLVRLTQLLVICSIFPPPINRSQNGFICSPVLALIWQNCPRLPFFTRQSVSVTKKAAFRNISAKLRRRCARFGCWFEKKLVSH